MSILFYLSQLQFSTNESHILCRLRRLDSNLAQREMERVDWEPRPGDSCALRKKTQKSQLSLPRTLYR